MKYLTYLKIYRLHFTPNLTQGLRLDNHNKIRQIVAFYG